MSVSVGEGVVTSITWISVSSLSEYRSLNTGILQGDIFSYFNSAHSQEWDRQLCLLSPSASHAFPLYTSTLIWSPPCLHLQFSLFPASCWNACCSVLPYLSGFKLSWHFLTLRISPQSQHAFNGLLQLWNDIHCFQVCLEYCQKLTPRGLFMLALSSFTPIMLMGKRPRGPMDLDTNSIKFGTLLIKAKVSLRLKNA